MRLIGTFVFLTSKNFCHVAESKLLDTETCEKAIKISLCKDEKGVC